MANKQSAELMADRKEDKWPIRIKGKDNPVRLSVRGTTGPDHRGWHSGSYPTHAPSVGYIEMHGAKQ